MCVGKIFISFDINFVDSSENCPITSIKITNNPVLISGDYETSNTIRGNYVLYFSRTTKDYPLSELRTVEGDGVCIKNEERPISSGRTSYALDVIFYIFLQSIFRTHLDLNVIK